MGRLITVAHQISNRFKAAGDHNDIAIVDAAEFHYYQVRFRQSSRQPHLLTYLQAWMVRTYLPVRKNENFHSCPGLLLELVFAPRQISVIPWIL